MGVMSFTRVPYTSHTLFLATPSPHLDMETFRVQPCCSLSDGMQVPQFTLLLGKVSNKPTSPTPVLPASYYHLCVISSGSPICLSLILEVSSHQISNIVAPLVYQ